MSSQVQAMLAKARQKSDFDAVTQHYGCCAEQIEEIREIANRDKRLRVITSPGRQIKSARGEHEIQRPETGIRPSSHRG